MRLKTTCIHRAQQSSRRGSFFARRTIVDRPEPGVTRNGMHRQTCTAARQLQTRQSRKVFLCVTAPSRNSRRPPFRSKVPGWWLQCLFRPPGRRPAQEEGLCKSPLQAGWCINLFRLSARATGRASARQPVLLPERFEIAGKESLTRTNAATFERQKLAKIVPKKTFNKE